MHSRRAERAGEGGRSTTFRLRFATASQAARAWPRIDPLRFTARAKVELIQRLIVAIEQRELTWPAAWTTLTDELKRFEYALSPSGAITYSAPAGYHDDCVIALALAVRGRFAPEGGGAMAARPITQGGRGLAVAGRAPREW